MQRSLKPTIFVAGATSIFGLKDLKKSFENVGFNVRFVDVPFMKEFLSAEETETIEFISTINISNSDFIIPLSEYWISYCISNNNSRISKNALLSSRSKAFFYKTLSSKNIDIPEIYKTKEKSLSALQNGKTIIVKPDGLHSGYGIEILKEANPEQLNKCFLRAQTFTNKAMRIMHIENKDAIITELLVGTEYSADCFWYCGKMSLVRLCKKIVVNIKNKPCTVCVIIAKPEQQIILAMESWLKALFGKTDISFAQFDFVIEEKTSRIMPIDFATRIGGGMAELLKEIPFNVYSSAVEEATKIKHENLETESFFKTFENKSYIDYPLIQLNYLSTKSGYIKNHNYPLFEGKKIIYKYKGDYAISNPSSVQSRLAVVVTRAKKSELTQDLVNSLLLSEPYIAEK